MNKDEACKLKRKVFKYVELEKRIEHLDTACIKVTQLSAKQSTDTIISIKIVVINNSNVFLENLNIPFNLLARAIDTELVAEKQQLQQQMKDL